MSVLTSSEVDIFFKIDRVKPKPIKVHWLFLRLKPLDELELRLIVYE